MGPADLMPLPDALNHIRAGGLGSTFATLSRRLLDTQVAGFQGREVPNWIGEAADAYTDSIRTLGDRVRQVASSVGGCSSELASWAEAVGDATLNSVPALHERYSQADLQYQRQVQSLSAQLAQSRDTVSQEDVDQVIARYASERDAEQEEVLRESERIMTALDDEAARVAKAIQAAVDQAIGIEGWSEGGGGNRTDLATELFNDIPVVDGQAEFERAQRDAQDAASYFGDLELTEEDVTEFTNRFGDRLDNPYFAAALSELVTPEQMTQFIMEADHLRFPPRPESSYPDTFDTLVSSMGYVMVLATGGIDAGGDAQAWEGFHAARKGLMTHEGETLEELAVRQAAEWREAGRQSLQFEPAEHQDPLGDLPPFSPRHGYEYMGLMMGAAGERYPGLAVGAAFCKPQEDGISLAQDIVAAERDLRRHNALPHELYNIRYVDTPFGGGTYPSNMVDAMLGLMDEPAVPTRGPAGAEWTWRGSRQADLERHDVVQSFLLQELPADFEEGLPESTSGASGGPMTMTRYLSGNRWEWRHSSSDEGDALGRLLAQMSDPTSRPILVETGGGPPDGLSGRSGKAAEVAAEFLEGYQDGLEKGKSSGGIALNGFGQSNGALRNWAGSILAPYISDMGESISKGGRSGEDLHGVGVEFHGLRQRPKLVISEEFLRRLRQDNGVFKDLALDDRQDVNGTADDLTDDISPYGRPPASEVLMAAAMRGYGQNLDWAFGGDVEPGQEPPGWELSPDSPQLWNIKKVVGDSASVMLLLDASDSLAAIDVGDVHDASVRRIRSLAQYVLDKVDLGGLIDVNDSVNPWIHRGVDAVQDQVLDRIFVDDAAARAAVRGAESHDSLERLMKEVAVVKFYQSGAAGSSPGELCEEYPEFREYVQTNYSELLNSPAPENWWEAPEEWRKAFRGWSEQDGAVVSASLDVLSDEVDVALNKEREEYYEEYHRGKVK